MKSNFIFHIALLACSANVFGQGTLVVDQQSAPFSLGGGSSPIQSVQPVGQSFTPSLSSIGFIQLVFQDHNPNNGLGATLYVNLRSDSITGSILAATTPVSMPDNTGYGSQGVATFYFAAPVSLLASSNTYYFNVVAQAGSDTWDIFGYNYGYNGGAAFYSGTASSWDLLFAEGIVVAPEPPPACFALLGLGAFLFFHRKPIKRPLP